MTEVIGDFPERQATRHEMSGASVPEHSPEAIDRQERENRAVSDVRRVIGRRVLDQRSDVVPRGPMGGPSSR